MALRDILADALSKADDLSNTLQGWADEPGDLLNEFTDAQLKDALEDRGFSVYDEDEPPVQDVDTAADALLKHYMPGASAGAQIQLTERIKAALVELGVSEGVI